MDVLAVYQDYGAARDAADALVEWGYDRRRDDPDWPVLSRTEVEPVVIHLRPRAAETWRDHLVFRELLRDNPDARAEYERAKRETASDHPDDVAAYTDAENEKIRSLEDRAYEEGYGKCVPAFDGKDDA